MNPIWISDDGRFRLEGPYAVHPSKPETLELTAPTGTAPTLELRFIAYDALPDFLDGRQRGALPFPADRSKFPAVTPTHHSAQSKTVEGATRHVYTFESDAHEGVYLAIVTPDESHGGIGARFHVVIPNRNTLQVPVAPTSPIDVTQIIVRHVNASYQLGVIYLVFGVVFFVEHYLHMVVAHSLKVELLAASAEEAPFTAADRREAEQLRTGRELGGVSNVWLDDPGETPSDDGDDERPCFQYPDLRDTGPEVIRHA